MEEADVANEEGWEETPIDSEALPFLTVEQLGKEDQNYKEEARVQMEDYADDVVSKRRNESPFITMRS